MLGHITSVEPATPSKSEASVGIIFDTVKTKNQSQPLHLLIRALAPEPEGQYNSMIAGGRGIPGETDHAALSGVDRADISNGLVLNNTSVGVVGFPGLQLEIRKSNGQQTAILEMTKGDVKLKKGTQLVLLVVS